MLGITANNLKVKDGSRGPPIDRKFGTNVVLGGKRQQNSERSNRRKSTEEDHGLIVCFERHKSKLVVRFVEGT